MSKAVRLPAVLITLEADAASRAIIAEVIGETAQVVHLKDLASEVRADALRQACVLLSRQIATERCRSNGAAHSE